MSLTLSAMRCHRFKSIDSEALAGTPPATESDVAIQAYLECLTGRPHLTGSSDATNAIAYIAYIKRQCKWIPTSLFTPAKGSSPPPNSCATDAQIFRALAQLAAGMRESSQWSVNDGINSLAAAGIFRVDLSAEDIASAAHIVFAMTGWITMLFTPQIPPSSTQDGLQVDKTGTRRFLITSQPMTKAERPFVEVLKGFGEILPLGGLETPKFDVGEAESDTLKVANLNMATLINIGRINVTWVKSISSHLEFDSLHRRLSLFCMPSFCMLNVDSNTPCESILNDFYDDGDLTLGALSAGHPLFKEILLSYRLLFADDSQARSIFRNKERERARLARGTPTEPYLDNLCGENLPHKSYLAAFRSPLMSPLTVSYSKNRDFPYLAGRLSNLQSYISAQQPNRLTALWYDRRNLLSWYTFWTVLIFGVVGISCSFIQTGMAVAQTVIAWKAYQAQLSSVQNS